MYTVWRGSYYFKANWINKKNVFEFFKKARIIFKIIKL